MLYPVIPENVQIAYEKGIKFLDGGNDGKEKEEVQVRLYSFEKDANFIYSAFKQTHSIDLENVELHWWKFLALFMDLGSDTVFCNLTGLRKRVSSGKATDDEVRAAQELGDIFTIESDERTPEMIEADEIFDWALEGGI